MSKELETVVDNGKCIELGGKKRELKFAFRAFRMIEERYGSVQDMGKAVSEKPMTNLPYVIFSALVDKTDVLDEDTVVGWLDDIKPEDLSPLFERVTSIITSSMPQTDKATTGKNA